MHTLLKVDCDLVLYQMKKINLNSSIAKLINKKKEGIIFEKNDFSFFIYKLTEKNKTLDIAGFLNTCDLLGLTEDEINGFISAINKDDEISEFNKEDYYLDYLAIDEFGDSLNIILGLILVNLGLKFFYIFEKSIHFIGSLFDKLSSIGVGNKLHNDNKYNTVLKEKNELVLLEVNNFIPYFDTYIKLLYELAFSNIFLYLIIALALKFKVPNTVLIINLKVGNKAIIKNNASAKKISLMIMNVAKHFKRKIIIIQTNADYIISKTVGVALEIKKINNVLENHEQFQEYISFIKKLIADILYTLNFEIDKNKTENLINNILKEKLAIKTFQRFVAKQRGLNFIRYNNFRINRYFAPKVSKEIKASKNGFINFQNIDVFKDIAYELNIAKCCSNNKIDYQAGIEFIKNAGDKVEKDETIAILYSSTLIDKNIINKFQDNILYYEKRDEFQIKTYYQSIIDNLNLIKVKKDD